MRIRIDGSHRGGPSVAAICLLAILVFSGGNGTGAGVVLSSWDDVGTVDQWRKIDGSFYRSIALEAPLDRSRDNLDQKAIYARTWDLRGQFDGLGLAAFQDLPPWEQEKRRDAAASELKYVIDFRNRMSGEVQNARSGMPFAWGTRISDHTVVADLLGRLRTAVAVAPDNPYAWHLYAYFASVAGDDRRALRACEGAEAALDALPDDALPELRAGVALDRAWLLRGQGDFAAAGKAVEQARANGARGVEPALLEGLIAAQTGDDQAAIEAAMQVRGVKVAAFPPNLETGAYVPDVTNVDAWRRKPSSYLHDWIMAWSWLHAGRPDMAQAVFGTFRRDDQRPFAARFWNEAGDIYLATGRPSLAVQAWSMALITTPYLPYLVSKPHASNLARLTGRSGDFPFDLGYDSWLIAGNRVAWAALMVDDLAAAEDEDERRALATRALDELEVCRRIGLFAGQAAVLQGQVYHLMGDTRSALVEVEEGLALLEAAGDRAGTAAVLSGLSQNRDELEPQDVARFFGQSGASRGRSRQVTDVAAERATLEAAYAENPDDSNRRALARFEIRSGTPSVGRELALAPIGGAEPSPATLTSLSAADLSLILEADRAEGEAGLARRMVAALMGGTPDPWSDAGVWALAGFICIDQGDNESGRAALERASELDPGNQGLKIQLSLM